MILIASAIGRRGTASSEELQSLMFTYEAVADKSNLIAPIQELLSLFNLDCRDSECAAEQFINQTLDVINKTEIMKDWKSSLTLISMSMCCFSCASLLFCKKTDNRSNE